MCAQKRHVVGREVDGAATLVHCGHAPLRMRDWDRKKPDPVPSSCENRTDRISFIVILPLASFSTTMSCCVLGRPAGITIFPTRVQLVDRRRRNEIGSGRYDHLVKGGEL